MIRPRRMEMGGVCSTQRAIRNTYKILGGRTEGKGPLRRPRHKWVDNIKMYQEKQSLEMCTGFIRLRIGNGGNGHGVNLQIS
jgi:hypothetical protein